MPMFSQIDRIDPAVLKPDPIKTKRDRGGSRENKSARKPEGQTTKVNDEPASEPNDDGASEHVIDVHT